MPQFVFDIMVASALLLFLSLLHISIFLVTTNVHWEVSIASAATLAKERTARLHLAKVTLSHVHPWHILPWTFG